MDNLNSEILKNIGLDDQDYSLYGQRINAIRQEKSRKQPKNSAKTCMPFFHNIDREIEDLRVRSTRFDRSIDKELSKLNNPQYEDRFSLTGINLKGREFKKRIQKASVTTGFNPFTSNSNYRRSSDTNDTSHDESLFTKVQKKRFYFKRSSLENSTKRIRAKSMNVQRAHSPGVNVLNSPRMDFNQYIKTVPMHQDPKYSFSKICEEKSSPNRHAVYRNTRLNKLDNIMDRCSLVENSPINNLPDLRKHLRTAIEIMSDVKCCMSSIERAGDASADQEAIEEVKNIQKREQLLEVWMKGHSIGMKEENTAMSEFIHHLGHPKQLTWRFPGPAFPKKTDKLLNSLPTQRYGS